MRGRIIACLVTAIALSFCYIGGMVVVGTKDYVCGAALFMGAALLISMAQNSAFRVGYMEGYNRCVDFSRDLDQMIAAGLIVLEPVIPPVDQEADSRQLALAE